MTLDEMLDSTDPEKLRQNLLEGFMTLQNLFGTLELRLRQGADPKQLFRDYIAMANAYLQSLASGSPPPPIPQEYAAPTEPRPRKRAHKHRPARPAPGAVQ
jgi:hypothetical protein